MAVYVLLEVENDWLVGITIQKLYEEGAVSHIYFDLVLNDSPSPYQEFEHHGRSALNQ